MVRSLAGRAGVSFGRRLGILRDGRSSRRVSAQLVLCRVVSMPAHVRGCGAWLRAGCVGGGPGAYPCWECVARKRRRRAPGPWSKSQSRSQGGKVQCGVRWKQQEGKCSGRYQQILPFLIIEGGTCSSDVASAVSNECPGSRLD